MPQPTPPTPETPPASETPPTPETPPTSETPPGSPTSSAQLTRSEQRGHPAAHVTADGSPVAVYLAVPAGPDATLIDGQLTGPSTVLELGAGAGRVTRVLVAYGHEVVAVDDDPAMLAHVTGAEVVCQDLYSLELRRRFDAVVAGSHLVNDADREHRRRLIEVAAAHVQRPDGVVLLERHRPEWAADPVGGTGWLGPVEVTVTIDERRASSFSATATYRLGERSWDQRFEAGPVDDDELADLGADVGLRFDGCLDDDRTWVRLRPTEAAATQR